MSKTTNISWTDHTFNIAWGCTKVSPGCTHCYADALSSRYGHDIWGPHTERRVFGEKHWREPLAWNKSAPGKVFCSSMCDIFEDHPTIDREREKLWPLILATPNLQWQLLTKRSSRIAECLPENWGDGYPNVWLGVSVEDQQRADERIPELLRISARVRFLSVEPLLEDMDIQSAFGNNYGCGGESAQEGCVECGHLAKSLDWVIVGGESGPGRRDCGVEAIENVAEQCREAGVPVFVKQDCELRPGMQGRIGNGIWGLKQLPKLDE